MSKGTRTKTTVVQGVTPAAYEMALSNFAVAHAKEKGILAKMDAEITRIREKYGADVDKLAAQKKEAFDVVHTYATENKEEFFSKKRSVETLHGTIGFRLGTPKLKTLKGFTWASITNMLKEFLPDYVRTVDEPAKDKILADRDTEAVAELLPKVGIMVDQDETFFIDLKEEEAAKIQ